jgi:hypothetical protein
MAATQTVEEQPGWLINGIAGPSIGSTLPPATTSDGLGSSRRRGEKRPDDGRGFQLFLFWSIGPRPAVDPPSTASSSTGSGAESGATGRADTPSTTTRRGLARVRGATTAASSPNQQLGRDHAVEINAAVDGRRRNLLPMVRTPEVAAALDAIRGRCDSI